jgi:hypothetical protein
MKSLTWQQVAQLLAAQAPGTKLRLPRHLTQHPADGGLSPTVGFPVGQRADYRLDDGGAQVLYVQDFGTHLEARLEIRTARTHAALNAGEAVTADEASTLVGTAVLGGLVGLLLGRSKDAALMGLMMGAVAGASAMAAEPNKALSEKGKASGTPEWARAALTAKNTP